MKRWTKKGRKQSDAGGSIRCRCSWRRLALYLQPALAEQNDIGNKSNKCAFSRIKDVGFRP